MYLNSQQSLACHFFFYLFVYFCCCFYNITLTVSIHSEVLWKTAYISKGLKLIVSS